MAQCFLLYNYFLIVLILILFSEKGGYRMEATAAMTVFPLFLILIYLAVIVFSIWFCVSLIKSQRERNQLLRDISNKLDNPSIIKKEE